MIFFKDWTVPASFSPISSFSIFNCTMGRWNFAAGGIQTADHWCRKRPLYQLCHHHCPMSCLPEQTNTLPQKLEVGGLGKKLTNLFRAKLSLCLWLVVVCSVDVNRLIYYQLLSRSTMKWIFRRRIRSMRAANYRSQREGAAAPPGRFFETKMEVYSSFSLFK